MLYHLNWVSEKNPNYSEVILATDSKDACCFLKHILLEVIENVLEGLNFIFCSGRAEKTFIQALRVLWPTCNCWNVFQAVFIYFEELAFIGFLMKKCHFIMFFSCFELSGVLFLSF